MPALFASVQAGIHPVRRAKGSGEVELVAVAEFKRDLFDEGAVLEHHVVSGLYVSFLFNQTGSLFRWHRDTFAASERDAPDIYDRLNREMPVEPRG
jgi:hypothetical protein